MHVKTSYRKLVTFLVGSVLLSSCSAGPSAAAEQWFKAMVELDGNKAMRLTCDGMKDEVAESGLILSAFSMAPQAVGQVFGMDLDVDTSYDLSDVDFQVISQESDWAQVQVSGVARVAVMGFSQEMPMQEVLSLVREDGGWKICG